MKEKHKYDYRKNQQQKFRKSFSHFSAFYIFFSITDIYLIFTQITYSSIEMEKKTAKD